MNKKQICKRWRIATVQVRDTHRGRLGAISGKFEFFGFPPCVISPCSVSILIPYTTSATESLELTSSLDETFLWKLAHGRNSSSRVNLLLRRLLATEQFEMSCNRPNPTNIALIFVRAGANPELVYKFHVALRTPNVPIKFLPCVVLPILSKFSHNAAPPVRRQIRPGSQLPSIAACSLPIILPSAISDSLPCFQANFTSRTIGYCLRKLRVIKKISP